jgi:hypothetical protein
MTLNLKDVDMTNALCLHPASYSKAQSVADIVRHIKQYPDQKPINSLTPREGREFNAVKYATDHVIEFQIEGERPVGTLSELRASIPDIDLYFIYPNQGNGLVMVKHTNGAFTVEDGFGDGWTE